jgi:hypothetical protein
MTMALSKAMWGKYGVKTRLLQYTNWQFKTHRTYTVVQLSTGMEWNVSELIPTRI